MLTTSDTFVLSEGSEQTFKGSDILVVPEYHETTGAFYCSLRVLNTDGNEIHRESMLIQTSDVDGESGVGGTDTETWFSALQQSVKTKLLALSDNSGVTFTIA